MLQIRPWVCIYFCCVGIHVKNLEISLRNLTILELPMPLTQKSFPRKPSRFWHFPPFVSKNLTCLVILFDLKLHFFKMVHLAFFSYFWSRHCLQTPWMVALIRSPWFKCIEFIKGLRDKRAATIFSLSIDLICDWAIWHRPSQFKLCKASKT